MAFVRFVVGFLVLSVSISESVYFLEKRNFVDLGCMGIGDRSLYTRALAVCEDCYDLYKDPNIYDPCRHNCFNNGNFSLCVQALHLLEEQEEEIYRAVRLIYGK